MPAFAAWLLMTLFTEQVVVVLLFADLDACFRSMAADDLIHRVASLDGVLGENSRCGLQTFGPSARLAKGVTFNLDLGNTVVRTRVVNDPVLGETGCVQPRLVEQ